MEKRTKKIGIIICDRYHSCAGGKCFRSCENREGAFSIYKDEDVHISAFAHCGGCPGGNIEYTPAEMKKNGIDVIHLATGMIVGYPPCTRIPYFKKFIEEQYCMEVVIGTHPIPEKYYKIHKNLGSWDSPAWQEMIAPTLCDEKTRLSYD